MIQAALFDWDGTLADSRAAMLSAWYSASEAVLGRRYPATLEEETLVFTRPGLELFAQLGGAAGPEPLTAAFASAYRDGVPVLPFPGVAETLGALRAEGVRIGVVTSKSRERYTLDAERTGLVSLIDEAACAQDTTAHKPDPAPVRLVLGRLGVAAGNAMMVGDTPVDIAAGAAAGVTAVGVAWGASGRDPLIDAGAALVVDDPEELVRFVRARREEEVIA